MTMPSRPQQPKRLRRGRAYRVPSVSKDVADYILEDATGDLCGRIQLPAALATPEIEEAIERFLGDMLRTSHLHLLG